jgi:hypothetical protein
MDARKEGARGGTRGFPRLEILAVSVELNDNIAEPQIEKAS